MISVRAFKPLVIEDEPPKHEQASTSTQAASSTASNSNSPVVTHSAEKCDDDVNLVGFIAH